MGSKLFYYSVAWLNFVRDITRKANSPRFQKNKSIRKSNVEEIVGVLDEEFGNDVHGHQLLDKLFGSVGYVYLHHAANLTASLAKVVVLLDVSHCHQPAHRAHVDPEMV